MKYVGEAAFTFCLESLETCLPDTADSVDIFIWKTKTSDVKLIYMNEY